MDEEEFIKEATEIYINNILTYEETHNTKLLANIEAVLHDGRVLIMKLKEEE